MSYIKFGQKGSDVYLYGGASGPPPDGTHEIVCSMCMLSEAADEWESPFFTSKRELFAHLDEHRAAGHVVPQSAVDRIKDEDWIS